jgi:hypothetical protein
MIVAEIRSARIPKVSMKICVYGAGADVSLVARGARLAAMKANGLTSVDFGMSAACPVSR